ncbi:MAG: hypothetical protein AAFY91_08995, partial [Bacteroidota bacterium]
GLKEGKKPYVKAIPKRVGIPLKYYLTPKAKKVLLELYDFDDSEVKLPKGPIYTDTQDQAHRTRTISIQIELDLACQSKGLRIDFTDRYFDTVGNNRVAKNLKSKTAFHINNHKTIKADLIFGIETEKQLEYYTLELENGSDSQKAVDKCIEHAQALLKGSLNEKFGISYGYRSLWVFEREVIMDKVIERLQQVPLFEHLHEYFLFKPLAAIEKDFLSGWKNVSAVERNLYY